MRRPPHIIVTGALLRSSSGKEYLALPVPKTFLLPFYKDLAQRLGKSSKERIMHQLERDGALQHMTIISPLEMKGEYISYVDFPFDITFHGLGRGLEGENDTYYIVTSSEHGAALRHTLGLPPRDFHITLGFSSKDIHGVRKGMSSLVLDREGRAETLKELEARIIEERILQRGMEAMRKQELLDKALGLKSRNSKGRMG